MTEDASKPSAILTNNTNKHNVMMISNNDDDNDDDERNIHELRTATDPIRAQEKAGKSCRRACGGRTDVIERKEVES